MHRREVSEEGEFCAHHMNTSTLNRNGQIDINQCSQESAKAIKCRWET